MGKDPAYLFYSKDWITGTAEMMPEEKGVFIDLLCYQHQNGSLPNETRRLARLVSLSESEFLEIWQNINHKFKIVDGRLKNKKLTSVMNERSEKGRKNKLIGTFAHVIKKFTKSEQKVLKLRFDVNELLSLNTEWNTERLTEWCLNGTPFIGNGDVNVNTDDNSIIIKNIKELFKNEQWQISLIKNLRNYNLTLTIEQIPEWIDKFIDKLTSEGNLDNPLNDMKSHFSRWIKLELNNNSQNIDTHDDTDEVQRILQKYEAK